MPVATPITFHASPKTDVWALNLCPLNKHTKLIASYSNGTIQSFPISSAPNKMTFLPQQTIQAHSGSINMMRGDQVNNLIATAASDGIKVWDLNSQTPDKPIHWFKNDRGIPFLSVAFDPINGNLIAGGTELKQSDSELHIWDLRTGNLVRSYIDSHHDDITELQFHPTKSNLLLSGSTDGYVNVYDLNEAEEEDSLFQVITGDSIHSAGWLTEDRVFSLSHMETFAIHQVNDISTLEDDQADVIQPTLFGDIREIWGCEYVVNVYPGYVAMGSNSKHFAKLHEFKNEIIDLTKSIDLNSAHGEEVVRDVYVKPGSQFIFTAGEDGVVKVWKNDWVIDIPDSFCQGEAHTQEKDEDIEMVDAENTEKKQDRKEEKEKKEKKEKKENKEKSKGKKDKKVKSEDDKKGKSMDKKEKKEKKESKKESKSSKKESKKESKSSKKESKKEKRFKPY